MNGFGGALPVDVPAVVPPVVGEAPVVPVVPPVRATYKLLPASMVTAKSAPAPTLMVEIPYVAPSADKLDKLVDLADKFLSSYKEYYQGILQSKPLPLDINNIVNKIYIVKQGNRLQ